MAENDQLYKVKAGEFEFTFSKEEIESTDLIKIGVNSFNLIKDKRSVNAILLDDNVMGKELSVEIDGERFDVTIQDELDQLLDKMGFKEAVGKQIKEIKAPMPGLVLEIAVTNGQDVNEGDKILILGAMKMENSILIQANARIKKILVSKGQAVEKGQVLVELE